MASEGIIRWGLLGLLVVGCTTPFDEPADQDSEGSSSTDATTGTPPDPTNPDPSAASGDGTTGGDESTDDGPDPTTDTGPPPAQCDTPSVFEPGDHTGIEIEVDGMTRRYDLFVPASYDPTAATPLVLNFHGLLGTPSQQAGFSQLNGFADDHGMIVAYPEGIGQSFNAGVCCGTASSTNVDDVAFARAIVADLQIKMCIDDARVYATGMSNGGHMAHRLACEAADVFAATASVAGVLSLAGPCTPSRPISMLQFHGTADGIVGYYAIPQVPAMMEAWAQRNGCATESQVTFQQGDTTCETWPDCDGDVEVTLCTIEGGGHCWPGNASCIFGASTTELHASEEILQMFEEQVMPP